MCPRVPRVPPMSRGRAPRLRAVNASATHSLARAIARGVGEFFPRPMPRASSEYPPSTTRETSRALDARDDAWSWTQTVDALVVRVRVGARASDAPRREWSCRGAR